MSAAHTWAGLAHLANHLWKCAQHCGWKVERRPVAWALPLCPLILSLGKVFRVFAHAYDKNKNSDKKTEG